MGFDTNVGNTSLRALALALFPSMKWRHHGIGVLQGYVIENVNPEIRLHIWDPKLLKPGMDISGDIHDHRFSFRSHVLCGSVGHEIITPHEDECGEWGMLKLTHARLAKENNYHGPTEPLSGRFSIERSLTVIPQGCSYRFQRSLFHRSVLIGGTVVTCVEKYDQREDVSARILHPLNNPPVMAFGHEMDWSIIGPVIERAEKMLSAT